jgi:hypothetical protein
LWHENIDWKQMTVYIVIASLMSVIFELSGFLYARLIPPWRVNQ